MIQVTWRGIGNFLTATLVCTALVACGSQPGGSASSSEPSKSTFCDKFLSLRADLRRAVVGPVMEKEVMSLSDVDQVVDRVRAACQQPDSEKPEDVTAAVLWARADIGGSPTASGSGSVDESSRGTHFRAQDVTFTARGFDFSINVDVNLSGPQVTTEGQAPPWVNVVAQVSGGGELTNSTSGYSAQANDIPTMGVWALYPKSRKICDTKLNGQPGFHPGPTNLCAINIAELAVPCSSAGQELTEGAGQEMVAWAQYAGSLLRAGDPAECHNVTDPVPETFLIKGIRRPAADASVRSLENGPKYWVLVNESGAAGDPAAGGGPDCQTDEYYIQGGDFYGEVVYSHPEGVKGCIGG